MTEVRVVQQMSGGRHDGQPWPEAGGTLDVPSWEAGELIRAGIAEALPEPEPAPSRKPAKPEPEPEPAEKPQAPPPSALTTETAPLRKQARAGR